MVLRAYWPLNESSGDTANEVINGEDGAVRNGGDSVVVGADGILGDNSYSFDGVNDYVDTSFSLSSKNMVSFSCWVAWEGSSTDTNKHWILHNRPSSGNRANIGLGINEGDIVFSVDVQGGGNVENVSVSTDIRDGAWHYISGVYDNTADRVKIFVDGAEDASATVTNDPNLSNMANYFIGRNSSTDLHHWDGKIQHVRIYDHALTQQEINYLYSVGKRGLHTSNKRSL